MWTIDFDIKGFQDGYSGVRPFNKTNLEINSFINNIILKKMCAHTQPIFQLFVLFLLIRQLIVKNREIVI